MTDGSPLPRPQIDVTSWSDAGSRDALDLVASSVAEMVGFEIAIISVVRGEQMFAVSVEGSNDATTAMLGLTTPVAMVLPELDRADDWGRFRFVPHERLALDVRTHGWVPDLTPIDAPDAWHPLDLLIAPLYDQADAMIGLLSIDVPMSQRRPGPTQRDLLQRYAVQAERALRMAVDRDELAERIRLAEAARRVVRFATSQDDLESVLDDCRHPLLEGFRADFLAIRTYPTEGLPEAGSPPSDLPPDVKETIRASSRSAWTAQRVIIVGEQLTPDPEIGDAAYEASEAARVAVGLGTTMLVPLGAGHESLGHVILGRKDPNQHWSPDEQAGALDIARDIGQAVVNSRNLIRGQELVTELRRLATYKSQVLSTVSHELKNPLSAVMGYVEMLDADPSIIGDARRSIDALDRAARRMGRVVDDLLLLSEVEDPEGAKPTEPMDAVPVLLDALELTRVAAARRDLTLEVSAPEGEVMVCCDVTDLDRVLTNLVSNAVKYSPKGSTISLSLVQHLGEVELAVADQGIGISAADQERLFTEFFRSTNPQAVAQPGTGLGLTICRRIVERHGGRIEVESELGKGSTFRVFLPSPP
ncbi:cell wall metabolism sensor histidine kinase WalK [Nocardioides sp.]|uniref:sensor histidine kinase n=1 Tax=Nocardioides sp. TaxID=35761 RepID=UPI0027217404|nr:GAF domain-containing sensor histidine kinase [Nocardioides sp.]MDO9457139.1 GAF domain-containing sensor histidine kinase [Nocardioides sp.]